MVLDVGVDLHLAHVAAGPLRGLAADGDVVGGAVLALDGRDFELEVGDLTCASTTSVIWKGSPFRVTTIWCSNAVPGSASGERPKVGSTSSQRFRLEDDVELETGLLGGVAFGAHDDHAPDHPVDLTDGRVGLGLDEAAGWGVLAHGLEFGVGPGVVARGVTEIEVLELEIGIARFEDDSG